MATTYSDSLIQPALHSLNLVTGTNPGAPGVNRGINPPILGAQSADTHSNRLAHSKPPNETEVQHYNTVSV